MGGAFVPPPLSLGVFNECYAAVANTNVQRKNISVLGAHLKGFLKSVSMLRPSKKQWETVTFTHMFDFSKT